MAAKRDVLLGALLAIASAITFATLPVFYKLLLNTGLSSSEIMQLRYTFGFLILLIYIVIFHRSFLRFSLRAFALAALLSFCLDQVTGYTYARALESIPATTSILFFYVFPLYVLVFSVIFYKKKVTKYEWLSILFVLSGCGLVLNKALGTSVDGTGLMYIVIASFTWALYVLALQKTFLQYRPLQIVMLVMFWTAFSFNIRNGFSNWGDFTLYQLQYGALLGLFPTAVSLALLYVAIQLTDGPFVALCSAVEPASTLIFSFFLLGDSISIVQLAGVALVTLGIVVKNLEALDMLNLGKNKKVQIE